LLITGLYAAALQAWPCVSLNPIKATESVLLSKKLPPLLSTGWFQGYVHIWVTKTIDPYFISVRTYISLYFDILYLQYDILRLAEQTRAVIRNIHLS